MKTSSTLIVPFPEETCQYFGILSNIAKEITYKVHISITVASKLRSASKVYLGTENRKIDWQHYSKYNNKAKKMEYVP